MGQIRDSGKSPKICWYDLQDESITVYLVLFVACAAMHRTAASGEGGH